MTKARILAVDDQLYFRVFLEDLLRKEGYEVVTSCGAEEAWDRIQQEPFDLILTDLVMPGMDGSELVRRVKERLPEQDILVVTSIGDVKAAVEAMKLGAADYLLKPLDAAALLRSLDSVLEARRMRLEHAQLLAENLEYMGAFSLYERALGLFANLSLEALADRIVEVLCLETHAHGGVLWLARAGRPGRLHLAGVRGLVRIENETEELDTAALPAGLEALLAADSRAFLRRPSAEASSEAGAPETAAAGPEPAGAPAPGTGRAALYVPLRHGGRLLGVARLTDKLDGGEFGEAERELADRCTPFAAQAVANALRFRALEQCSFRDASTGAYTQGYFEDVTRNEIEKANRFGRSFALVRIALQCPTALRTQLPAGGFDRWLQDLTHHIARSLRATDLLASENPSQFCLLLPETDALGAAVLKRRIRGALERCPEVRDLDAGDRPTIFMGTASFPTDAADLEGLYEVLATRVQEDRRSVVRTLELESAPFRGLVDALLADAQDARPETAEQMTRLVLSEVGRRPEQRGLLFLAPGACLLGALREGLESVRSASPRTEIVVVADRKSETLPRVPVTWVSPVRAGTQAPFLVYFGEGPCYALIRDEVVEDGRTSLFHTSDPVLVEHMAFQLGRDLGIPIGE